MTTEENGGLPRWPRIDQPQFAHLAAVAGGVEYRRDFLVSTFSIFVVTRHHVVHAGQEAIRGAHVSERLDVQVGG